MVLRPRDGKQAITIGSAFVTVSGGPTASTWTRGRGGVGVAVRLRAYLADVDPGRDLPEIHLLSIVDGVANELVALAWSGADHDSLERACRAAWMPLDRLPDGARRPDRAVPTGRPVVVPAPGVKPSRSAIPSLTFSGRDVVLTQQSGQQVRWHRLGCVPPERLAVARMRITLFASAGGQARVLAIGFVGAGGLELAELSWLDGDLLELRRAGVSTGLLVEYRWRASELEAGPPAEERPPATRRARRAPLGPPNPRVVIYAAVTVTLLVLAAAILVLG